MAFSHAVLRSVGGSNPAFWIIPADLLSAEGAQTQTQKLGSKLVLIPGAGHAATFEKASATNAAILNWAKMMK